jgi:IS30 family transposase
MLVDLVGPLHMSKNGESHIFMVVDQSTRWAQAIPLSSTTADSCATALVSGWVSRFGVLNQITSDRGPQFAKTIDLSCIVG